MALESTPEDCAEIDAALERMKLPRTRENIIIWMFGEVPEEWNEEREVQLPPDVQVWPCPDHAMGH